MFTHSENSPDGVLLTQDQCTSIPEGQSIRQVDDEEGEAHGDVSREGLLYSHSLSILQVFMVSMMQHMHIRNYISMATGL